MWHSWKAGQMTAEVTLQFIGEDDVITFTTDKKCPPSRSSSTLKTSNLAWWTTWHMTAISEWHEAWSSSDVINRSFIKDPSTTPPDCNLHRRLWCAINRFRTGQGRCVATVVRWNQASDFSCSCGAEQLTMQCIVALWRSSREVCRHCTWLTRMLSTDSAHSAYDDDDGDDDDNWT